MAEYRVSPPRVWPEVARAPRPPESVPSARETHRQTGFTLSDDLDTLLQAFEAEAGIAAASVAPKYRRQPTVAMLATWSRAWLLRVEALHAAECGSYGAAIALIRTAAELTAAIRAIDGQDGADWQAWLADGGIGRAPDVHAVEFRLGAAPSPDALDADDAVGRISRASTVLSAAYPGATALLAASGSDSSRVAATFGDRDFHIGLAELCFGWLLELSLETLAIVEQSGRFLVEDDRLEALRQRVRPVLARRDRCRLSVIERDGEQRYLLEGVRRAAGGAPTRILL